MSPFLMLHKTQYSGTEKFCLSTTALLSAVFFIHSTAINDLLCTILLYLDIGRLLYRWFHIHIEERGWVSYPHWGEGLYLDIKFINVLIKEGCDIEECVVRVSNKIHDVKSIWQLHYPRRLKLRWQKYFLPHPDKIII